MDVFTAFLKQHTGDRAVSSTSMWDWEVQLVEQGEEFATVFLDAGMFSAEHVE